MIQYDHLSKSKAHPSTKAGEQTDMSLVSVNAWMKRFLSEGITGRQTRPGCGRKPVMDCSDEGIPSPKTARLNIFGMIDCNNHYEGFTTAEGITADKIASFLDTFSYRVRKDTIVVPDESAHKKPPHIFAERWFPLYISY